MAKRFFMAFFFGLGLFALLIFLGDMFDKTHYLLKSKASLGVILQYLWLEVPYWAIRVIPMATLLATLIALSGLIKSGEWIAVQASGFEPRDFWLPLLGCALCVTVFSFIAQETVLPACYRRARKLWQDKIHPEWEWDKYQNVALIGGPGEFIQASVFLPKDGWLERPILEKIGPRGIERQLDAREARWDQAAQRWIFYDGVDRQFSQGLLTQHYFAKQLSDLAVPPRNLIPRTRNPDEMSLREIRRYAETVSRMGLSPRQLSVAAYDKVAYPFTNLIICALGIPLALRLRSSSKVFSFFAALALSFMYLWMIEIGRVLGNSGALPPLLSAWGPNTLFAGLAVFMLRRYKA
ncbi:MAG: hypothetical protein A3J74_02370 [Elusimicrobia bacterium RIFCSPHIGHO2_02_FULL_57_9]|nr:MAG: hypothetical protein A3J74_02370 [Elusimicrobia bacterium RIFCSPHIGHO2_02_FULL_57_9]